MTDANVPPNGAQRNGAFHHLSPNQIARTLGGEARGNNVVCPGPGHGKHDRSLSIEVNATAPGGFVLHSFAGDDPIACRDYVRGRLGLPAWEKSETPSNGHAPKRQIVATYDYEDETGAMVFQAVRYSPKGFSQRQPDGKGGWMFNLKGVNLVPYGLPEVVEAAACERRIYIVEGEKDADILRKAGLVATCNPMGAGKWRDSYREYFRGAEIVILPDNDQPGHRHAANVAKSLQGVASSIRIMRLPDLPDKGDVADWLAAGGSAKALEEMCGALDIERPEERYVDNGRDAQAKGEAVSGPLVIKPRAFTFPDEKNIPNRSFIMGASYIRKYVSATIAPAGMGKSALVTVEALALATGKRLLGFAPRKPQRVWYIGEDDQDELNRRVTAVMKAYGIKPEDVGDRLMVQSFRDLKICVASKTPLGPAINTQMVEAILRAIKEHGIDVLLIDPLVKTHALGENDNMEMELVYTAWGQIADRANCAVQLVIHTRKAIAGQQRSIEDVRGASAQLGAVRDARLIVRMTDEEAMVMGIEKETASRHIRVGDTKANMTPHPDSITWMKLESVHLDNAAESPEADNPAADNVQVVMLFKPPSLMDGMSYQKVDEFMRAIAQTPRRQSDQVDDWCGHLLGEILDIDTREVQGKRRAQRMLRAWLKNGSIIVERLPDAHRQMRPCLTVGEWTYGGGGRR